MSPFIRKLIIFLLVGLLLAMATSVVMKCVYTRLTNEGVFRLDESVRTIVIGDSHPKTALDPDVLADAVNTADSLENFFCSYYKLRRLLDANPSVRNVVLGFSFHNVSMHHEKILFNDECTQKLLATYFLLLDAEAIGRIRSFSKPFLINYLKYRAGVPIEIYKDDDLLRNLFGPVKFSRFPFAGGFYLSTKSNLSPDFIKKKIDVYFYDGGAEYMGTSPMMIEYLEKIIALCAERNVRLYLFNGPLHPEFRRLIPAESLNDLNALKERLLAEHPHVTYLDMVGYPLEDFQYGDGDHVNKLGSDALSRDIRKRIR